MDEQHVIVWGNPIDGLSFCGPFEDHDLAVRYAEANYKTHDWWIAGLDKPSTLHASAGKPTV